MLVELDFQQAPAESFMMTRDDDEGRRRDLSNFCDGTRVPPRFADGDSVTGSWSLELRAKDLSFRILRRGQYKNRTII